MDLAAARSAPAESAAASARLRAIARGVRSAGWALALWAGLVTGAAHADTPGVRLPEGEFASESWDVMARLDSGHFVIAQAALSNLGPGDHNAVVIGHLIEPGGNMQLFKRSEPRSKWTLTEERRGIDLRSIALTPFGPERRFVVSRDALGVDLALAGAGAAGDVRREGPCSFELLETASPAAATLRIGAGAEPIKTRARVALTHRWSTALEAECAQRRLEVFVLERDLGLYFAETTTPHGDVSRWLVAERDGRTLFAGEPSDASVRWSESGGFAPPERARFVAPGLSGSFSFDPALASVDPTDRLPAPVQWLIATQTKPQLAWMQAPFDLQHAGAEITGVAMAKLTYSNPLPRGRSSARATAHSEE